VNQRFFIRVSGYDDRIRLVVQSREKTGDPSQGLLDKIRIAAQYPHKTQANSSPFFDGRPAD